MKVKTTRFGELTVPEETILCFPEGIIGFEKFKQYVILSKKENAPLRWLQSLDEPSLAFIIINPHIFISDYEPPVEKQDLQFLKVKSLDETEVLSIVVVPKNPRDMVANLMAPILVNPKLRVGKQAIIKDGSYPTRYRILDSYDKNPEAEQTVSC
ncbi:flagellar assembly protein FliW [bacterium]|nr:flagellar assembly protein FliW [candidate division CSSED10-310 bacterium]